MARKKHKPEEIVAKLRQVDVLASQGRPVAEATRAIGVTAFTYYRWRKEFGGLKSDQVRRLKELEKDRAIEAPLVQAQWRGSGCGRRCPISRWRSSSFGRPRRETTEPRPSPPLRRACREQARRFRATGVPGPGAASFDAARNARGARRRGGSDGRHRGARHAAWPLRLWPELPLERHWSERQWRRHAPCGGLGGEREARRADLATGGAEGARQTTEERPAPAERRLLRPERPNHVRSYDFVEDQTHDGRKFRLLNVVDAFTRERLAIRVDRKLKSTDVVDVLSELFILRGVPGHVRSDKGPEFVAKAVRDWITAVGAKAAFVEPGSPWDGGGSGIDPGDRCPTTGFCESFNSKLRDEPLNGELFHSLAEARIVVEAWRRRHDTIRPHSSPGCKPPAPEVAPWSAPQAEAAPPAAPAVAPRPIMHQDSTQTTQWGKASLVIGRLLRCERG